MKLKDYGFSYFLYNEKGTRKLSTPSEKEALEHMQKEAARAKQIEKSIHMIVEVYLHGLWVGDIDYDYNLSQYCLYKGGPSRVAKLGSDPNNIMKQVKSIARKMYE